MSATMRVYKRTAQCLVSSSRAVVHICVVLHAIASPDDRCHRGKPASMRHDGSLCDVDQHILALVVCGFGWHTRTFVTQSNTILISSTDTGPLHSKWHEACTVISRTVVSCMMNTFAKQGMDRSPRTLTFRQVRALCTKRADWRSDHCHCC